MPGFSAYIGRDVAFGVLGYRKDLLAAVPLAVGQVELAQRYRRCIPGGQIFPFGLLTRLAYGVSTGFTPLGDGRLLNVSRGTGTWGPPIRLLAEPEITLITLESEKMK